jgi:hypothetical protein
MPTGLAHTMKKITLTRAEVDTSLRTKFCWPSVSLTQSNKIPSTRGTFIEHLKNESIAVSNITSIDTAISS